MITLQIIRADVTCLSSSPSLLQTTSCANYPQLQPSILYPLIQTVISRRCGKKRMKVANGNRRGEVQSVRLNNKKRWKDESGQKLPLNDFQSGMERLFFVIPPGQPG